MTTIFLLADGGSILNHQQTIQALSQKQIRIREHLREIDRFLTKYDQFAKNYLARLKAILVSGAKCEISKEEYLYSKNQRGENNKFTIIRKGIYDDCYQMKANRLEAISNVKLKVSSLKAKVNEVLELKEIDIAEADRIKEYIDDLRSDVAYYKNNSNF